MTSLDMTPLELFVLVAPPLAFLIGGLIVGFTIEPFILRILRHALERGTPEGGALLTRHLRGQIVIWCTIGGAILAIHTVSVYVPTLFELLNLLLRAALVFSITIFGARLAGGLVSVAASRTGDALPAPDAFVRLTQGVILVIGILIALEAAGVSVMPILAALGVGGLAVGLALQAPLTNLFAGIYIMISRKIKPGDFIKLVSTGQQGYVVNTDFKHTTIRELPNNMIIVPNSTIMTSDIQNYHMPVKEMSVLVNLGVSYDSDLERVEAITLDVARETLQEVEGGVPEFTPLIRFNDFDDFSIRFTCVLRAREFVDSFLLKHEFIKRLHRRYILEHIEIPFPIRTLHIRDLREATSPFRPQIAAQGQDGANSREVHAESETNHTEFSRA